MIKHCVPVVRTVINLRPALKAEKPFVLVKKKNFRPKMIVRRPCACVANIDKTLHPVEWRIKTLRPVSSDDATLRAEQQKAIEAITRQHDTEYLIKGLNYRVIKVISDGTGEA